MKVAILTPNYFPCMGGTQILVLNVAKALKSRGIDVEIFTPKLSLKDSKRETIEGVTVNRSPRLFNNLFSTIYFHSYFFNRLRKFDLIHVFHPSFGLAPLIIKRLFNKKLIVNIVGWDTFDPFTPMPKFFWPYMAQVMNSADELICSSSHLKKWARIQGCNRKIKMIPHGISIKKGKIVNIFKKHRIKQNTKVAFSLQRLHRRKGLEYLIKAIPLVIKKTNKIQFLIGGDGPEKENLIKLSKKLKVDKYIIFLGKLPSNELRSYYSQSDIFVLPSLYEGFGIVYVDALSCGLPIVTTKCGGSEEIVNNNNGLLVPTKNSKALADAIIKALRKKWNRKLIKKKATGKFMWEDIIKKYLELYF